MYVVSHCSYQLWSGIKTVVLPFLTHTSFSYMYSQTCTHTCLTGVSQVHSLSRFQPEVGCVPRPSRDGRLAGSIPSHGSPTSLPSHVGSLHHHLPMPDDPPLDRTLIQKVRSGHTILPWVRSRTSIMRTPLVPSKVFWVKRCPYFGGFRYTVDMAMHTHTVECYKGAFQISPWLYAGEEG